ncbi:MAG: hypothetical protein GEU98_22535 [Pseudonocardiaceae bacterium]|nr:hypothetical protein [Pseudonocardiaceae bacterium]
MLKKAGFVAATTAGLLMIGGTAVASPMSADESAPAGDSSSSDVTFADAYYDFKESGGALGYGAAGLVASAYTGIATTPSLVAGQMGG